MVGGFQRPRIRAQRPRQPLVREFQGHPATKSLRDDVDDALDDRELVLEGVNGRQRPQNRVLHPKLPQGSILGQV